eukprot:760678-Hanusia_phi.AAC.1
MMFGKKPFGHEASPDYIWRHRDQVEKREERRGGRRGGREEERRGQLRDLSMLFEDVGSEKGGGERYIGCERGGREGGREGEQEEDEDGYEEVEEEEESMTGGTGSLLDV